MPNRLVWWVDDVNPSITETITINREPRDLTGLDVNFRMRAVGSEALLIDTAADIDVDPTTGGVSYDWQSTDLTEGDKLVWWVVDPAGDPQSVGEALIEVRAHAPQTSYMELAELKSTLSLTDNFADGDLKLALSAASRAIDGYKGTRFYPSEETRYYTAQAWDASISIDDLAALGSIMSPSNTITLDMDGDGVYEETWTQGTDFVLSPANADLEGKPWQTLEILLPKSGRRFSRYTRGIEIVGVFGWAQTPSNVKQATGILAARLFKRSRETPYAILSVVAGDAVAAARLGRIDPDVAFLLDNIPGVESNSRFVSLQLG